MAFVGWASSPTSGSATYNGYAYGDLANTSDAITDSLIGDIEMTVTFTASSATVAGQIGGFEDEDGDDVAGSLTLSGGSLDRSGNPSSDSTFGVSISGTLTDDAARNLVIGGRLEGDFLGSGHAAVGGELLGTVTVDSTSQNIDGGFIAER